MKGLFSSKLIKKDGKLVYEKDVDAQLYKEYVSNLEEGQVVNILIDVSGKELSLSQLSIIHTLIRVIANHTGTSFEDIKLEVKKKSGLCYKTTGQVLACKSFADCTSEDIDLILQACIELGDFVGINLRL